MPLVSIDLGTSSLAVDPKVDLDAEVPGTEAVLLEDLVLVDVEGWVALEGTPTAHGAFAGSAQMASSQIVPDTVVGDGDLDPLSTLVHEGLAATRFLMYRPLLRFRAPHRGYGPDERYFPPVDFTGAWDVDPNISLEVTTALADENIRYVAVNPSNYHLISTLDTQPALWPNAYYPNVYYTYRGARGLLRRHALCFETVHGVACLSQGDEQSYEQLTIAITAVLKPSAHPWYAVFETTGASATDFIQIRYAHGRIEVIYQNQLAASHECVKGTTEPTIIMLSLDSDDDVGRLFVHDRVRTSKLFKASGLVGIPLEGSIGAARKRSIWPDEGYTNFADMDLLEVDVWPEAMTFSEMEPKAALLAASYGVSL